MEAFSIEKLSAVEVLSLLNTADEQYQPALSQGINLQEYSLKLADFAEFLILKNKKAFIAFYSNLINKSAYIPLIWVDESIQGMGVAYRLLISLINRLKDDGFLSLSLEVRKDNAKAYRLYEKIGFFVLEDRGIKNLLSIKL